MTIDFLSSYRSKEWKIVGQMLFEVAMSLGTLIFDILFSPMHEEEDEREGHADHSRRTTVNYQTHDQNELEKIIQDVSMHHSLTLPTLVAACENHPEIREEPKLLGELFLKPEVVEDMVIFLLCPHRLMGKYNLSTDQARKFVKTLLEFMRQNYEFYEYYFIGVEKAVLKMECWFEFLEEAETANLPTALGHFAAVFIPFIKYEYSSSSRVCDYFEKIKLEERPILVINLLTGPIVEKLTKFTQFEAVFRALFNLVLASLEDQEWRRSLAVLKQLCLSGVGPEGLRDSHVENVHWMIREVSNNISNDKNRTIFAFIDAFIQSSLVKNALKRLTALTELAPPFTDQTETLLQLNFKILTQIVNIYYLLRKNGIDCQALQMRKLKLQIAEICRSLELLLRMVIELSNGQNVRSVCLFRYDFFNLLRTCLLLVRDYAETAPELRLQVSRMQILDAVQRALEQNRWNNIMHCLLQKIICLVINTDFFKTKGNNIHRFLDFLIEAFSNRKYVFLNSTRMTSQGDIHSIYFISRKVSSELEKASVFLNITNEYDTWRQFIINSLQLYENMSERISCRLPQEEEDEFQRHEKDEDFKVEIDELVSIKEMVRKIEINKKWNIKKENDNHLFFRSGSTSSLEKKKSHTGPSDYLATSNKKVVRVTINDEKNGQVSIANLDIDDQKTAQMRESSIHQDRIKKNAGLEKLSETGHSHSDSSIKSKVEIAVNDSNTYQEKLSKADRIKEEEEIKQQQNMKMAEDQTKDVQETENQ